MKKTFTVEGTEYTVEQVTAIATSAGDSNEDQRQDALLVTYVMDSGEKFEYVVFGFDMPENEEDYKNMCGEPSAWESDWETLETVRGE